MSFISIALLVLVALIILCFLFIFFKMFFALLPVALIAILFLWLFYYLTRGHDKNDSPDIYHSDNKSSGRKPARDVSTKDVDK